MFTPDIAAMVPPNNIEAEESVLGGILLDPDAMGFVENQLTPETFFISSHQVIYRAFTQMRSLGLVPDLIGVTDFLRSNKLLSQIGGALKLTQLLGRTVSSVCIDIHAKLIKDKFLRRQLISIGNVISQLGHDEITGIESLVEEAEKKLYEVRGSIPSTNQPEAVGDIAAKVMTEIEQGMDTGVTTSFVDLDAKTHGLRPQTFTVVAARTGVGKSHFCIDVSLQVASRTTKPVLFLSGEMSKFDVVYRMISRASIGNRMHGGIESDRLIKGKSAINDSEWNTLAQAVGGLCHLNVFIHEMSCNIIEIPQIIRKVSNYCGDLSLVVVDYLQLLGHGDAGNKSNRVQELSQISRQIKLMSKQFNVPFLVAAQINRSVESRQDKRPLMSDIKDCGSIEQDADVIHSLYREDYYDSNSADSGTIEIITLKNRRGPTGTTKLYFDPQFSRFRNTSKTNLAPSN